MKMAQKMALSILLCLIAASISANEAYSYSFTPPANDVERFIEFRNEIAQTPEGALSAFLWALDLYAREVDHGEGALVLTLTNTNRHLQRGQGGYGAMELVPGIRAMVDRTREAPELISQYFSPGDGGQVAVTWADNSLSSIGQNQVRLYVKHPQRETLRIVRLEQTQSGLWKVAEFSGLIVGLYDRPPLTPGGLPLEREWPPNIKWPQPSDDQ